ncbi:hypothetical protein [Bacillus marinisedimentorum]|uniref:hypothetical protein n=1 Tax=Bacillus marinisedimentorum TaxID=1821260 RepID=UPI0007E1347B|nr:hypothetical protein [Bacillus marinisedimentorum]
MEKKWLLRISASLLAAMLITGCADNADPAEEENGGTEEQAPEDDTMDEGTDATEEGTGVGTDEGNGDEGADMQEGEGTDEGTDEDAGMNGDKEEEE